MIETFTVANEPVATLGEALIVVVDSLLQLFDVALAEVFDRIVFVAPASSMPWSL